MADDPKRVRNFWTTTRTDGRETLAKSGPNAGDGGQVTTIRQRHRGNVGPMLHIESRWLDGTLRTWATVEGRPIDGVRFELRHPDGTVTEVPQGTGLCIVTER